MTHRVPLIARTGTSSKTDRLSRRQLLLQKSKSASSSLSAAEVCGGTAADCAAVCCCVPYGIVNLVALAVYKFPARLCKQALRHHRRRRRVIKPGSSLPATTGNSYRWRYGERDIKEEDWLVLKIMNKEEEETWSVDEAVVELEKEMWNRFYATGFWRSPSQSETTSSSQSPGSSQPQV